jgi:hypothetical protein
MTNPEKAPDPAGIQIQMDSEDSETVEIVNVVSDTTVRPMRESLRKHLKPPYNGQPFPPEVQAEIDRLRASATGDEEDIIDLDESNLLSHDTTVRPMRERLRKRLRPPYNGQPLPAAQPQEPPKDTPPS